MLYNCYIIILKTVMGIGIEGVRSMRNVKYFINEVICNCKQVSLFDIEDALYRKKHFSDVEKEFEEVQKITHCSTGCGGCHDKIMAIISDLMSS